MGKKVLFTATVDSHILHFHVPYLKLFKEKGYEVHVATNGDEKIPYCDVKHKISFERSPYKLNNLKAIKDLRKIILKEKFDIIHTHTPMGSVVTRLASIKAREKGTKVFYTAHGFHFYKGASKLNWLIFYPVEKFLSKYTDCLITINKEDYDLAKEKFKKCKQIEYVPGVGIDEEKFNFKMAEKEKIDLRKSIGLKKDDFVLIYPAELSERKRQEWLINTLNNLMDKHNNIHLLLPGKDSLSGKLNDLIKELNLEKQVHLLGYRKDIPKLLYISDIAVSSARQEGLPVNIMEAMYVGLPIVASDCRGNRDLVKNNKNGYLIDLEDNENFSKKIEKLYKDKEKYKDFEEFNKKEIQQYRLNNITDMMEKIYFKNIKIIFYTMAMTKGGAERVISNLSNQLVENNFDVSIVTNKNSKCYYELNKKIKFLCIDKNSKDSLLANVYRKISYYRTKKLLRYIKMEEPDIIIGMLPEPSLRLLQIKNKVNSKIIISDRNDPNSEYSNILLRKIVFKLYKKADGFIFQTEDAKKYFDGIIKCSSKIIPNPINPKFIKEPYKGERKKTIVTVGRLENQKNHELLIDSYKKLEKEYPDYKLLIYGDGSKRKELQEKIDNEKLSEKVKLMGKIDNVEQVIYDSSLFVLSSDYEGMPNALMEAMALGIPCISTDCPCGGPRFLIKNNVSGILVPVGDVEKMYQAMKTILKDTKKSEKLGKEANKIKDTLNPSVIYKTWEDFIIKILKED